MPFANKPLNHETVESGPSRRKLVPRTVREATLLRLEPEQQRYIDAGAALSFEFAFKQEYLYITARQPRGVWGGGLVVAPLCRLRYVGDPERWRFEVYLYSDDGYDAEQDFPYTGGSPEDCFAVAADFYLLQYDVLEAGSSRREALERSQTTFRGEARLLPPRQAPGPVELPLDFPGSATVSALPLLADLEAFLQFIDGRVFDLAPRTLGFRRKELTEVNGHMGHPAALHSRPVQSEAPRVQCCFAVAEALGMLRVLKALHRAEATPEVARFRAMEPSERLWSALEAIWQRVRWTGLRPRASGHPDVHQAGRCWLGAELARRRAPLEFDWSLTIHAEVLEAFLFPFWRDAGLLTLQYDSRMPVPQYYEKRATRLHWAEPTEAGRLVFQHLSEVSPGHERLSKMAAERDGQWNGSAFVTQLGYVAIDLEFDPTGPT